MPFRTLFLRPAVGADVVITRLALWALCVLVVRLDETSLMKGVFAEEMYCREIKGASTSGAAPSLEYGGSAR